MDLYSFFCQPIFLWHFSGHAPLIFQIGWRIGGRVLQKADHGYNTLFNLYFIHPLTTRCKKEYHKNIFNKQSYLLIYKNIVLHASHFKPCSSNSFAATVLYRSGHLYVIAPDYESFLENIAVQCNRRLKALMLLKSYLQLLFYACFDF